jgi:hypothetical protein
VKIEMYHENTIIRLYDINGVLLTTVSGLFEHNNNENPINMGEIHTISQTGISSTGGPTEESGDFKESNSLFDDFAYVESGTNLKEFYNGNYDLSRFHDYSKISDGETITSGPGIYYANIENGNYDKYIIVDYDKLISGDVTEFTHCYIDTECYVYDCSMGCTFYGNTFNGFEEYLTDFKKKFNNEGEYTGKYAEDDVEDDKDEELNADPLASIPDEPPGSQIDHSSYYEDNPYEASHVETPLWWTTNPEFDALGFERPYPRAFFINKLSCEPVVHCSSDGNIIDGISNANCDSSLFHISGDRYSEGGSQFDMFDRDSSQEHCEVEAFGCGDDSTGMKPEWISYPGVDDPNTNGMCCGDVGIWDNGRGIHGKMCYRQNTGHYNKLFEFIEENRPIQIIDATLPENFQHQYNYKWDPGNDVDPEMIVISDGEGWTGCGSKEYLVSDYNFYSQYKTPGNHIIIEEDSGNYSWLCTENFDFKVNNKLEFEITGNQDKYQWVKCAYDKGSAEGDSFLHYELISGKGLMYCTDGNVWTDNLDNKDDCNNGAIFVEEDRPVMWPENIYTQEWDDDRIIKFRKIDDGTTKKCCGASFGVESTGDFEFFNSNGEVDYNPSTSTVGGCWNNNMIPHGVLLSDVIGEDVTEEINYDRIAPISISSKVSRAHQSGSKLLLNSS